MGNATFPVLAKKLTDNHKEGNLVRTFLIMGKKSSIPKSWFIKKHPGAPSPTIISILSITCLKLLTWITGRTTGPICLKSL